VPFGRRHRTEAVALVDSTNTRSSLTVEDVEMSRTTSHHLAATTVVLALALAACGTSGGDSDGTTASSAPQSTAADTTAPETTAVEPTTTEAGPPADLLFGFDLSSGDINATRDKYGVKGQSSNLLNEDYYVALIDSYNEAGGIAGHKIVPVTYTPPTGDVPSDVVNQERCEQYFKGDQVADVVVGTNDAILNTCATDAGKVLFGRGFTGVDQKSLDAWPGFLNPQAATFDRAALATVDLAVNEGKVAAGTSVGVIYPGCDAQSAVFDDSLKPALEKAGATVSAFKGTCILSKADEGTALSELPNAILQWKTDNVTAVFNLSTGFIPVVLMMNEADKQGMTPTWVLNTNNEFGAMGTMNPPAAQMANVIAAGWSAGLDTFETDPAKLGPKAQECLDKYAAVGFPAPANIGELASQLDVCSTFFALEIMLAGSPGAIDRDAMMSTLAASTEDTAALTNSLDWTAGRQPNVTYTKAVYDTAGAKFVYEGSTVPMPES
jgi:hypothetical protein